jgi:hypothetical protein
MRKSCTKELLARLKSRPDFVLPKSGSQDVFAYFLDSACADDSLPVGRPFDTFSPSVEWLSDRRY